MTISNESAGLIPVIDISGSLPQRELAKQIVDAAATYGFVYIRNLGKDIPVEAIDSIFDLVCAQSLSQSCDFKADVRNSPRDSLHLLWK